MLFCASRLPANQKSELSLIMINISLCSAGPPNNNVLINFNYTRKYNFHLLLSPWTKRTLFATVWCQLIRKASPSSYSDTATVTRPTGWWKTFSSKISKFRHSYHNWLSDTLESDCDLAQKVHVAFWHTAGFGLTTRSVFISRSFILKSQQNVTSVEC